ncbi:MAG TPA: signal peptide peptidase SppA [Tepidisphaeraceae bacterium]|jgi:protease-4
MRRFAFPLFLTALALALTGCGYPSLLVTPVANTSNLEEVEVQEGKGFTPAKIAIVDVDGMLMNARTSGWLQMGENKLSLFTQQMQMCERDPTVRAVVLRINSPGGTVTCSDTMYDTVKRFKAETKKPVVASAQEVCASGAYYLACSSDVIVANPTSVVGSIGVIMQTFEVSSAMAKLGIKSESITSGPLKDMGSPFKPLDPSARAVMQGMINDYYGRFVGVVKENRPRLSSEDNVKIATDGRVFSGEQALAMGLVDKVGRLEDAIDVAKQMAHAPDAKVVMYKRPFGYSGSIYANQTAPPPRANSLSLELPEEASGILLPRGFYYLWQP